MTARQRPPAAYAELCVTSNFTFLTGASHPEELVTRAAELGLSAIAITDRNSLAGVVRAHTALRELARMQAEARQAQVTVRSQHLDGPLQPAGCRQCPRPRPACAAIAAAAPDRRRAAGADRQPGALGRAAHQTAPPMPASRACCRSASAARPRANAT